MFSITYGLYTLSCHTHGLPYLYEDYNRHAEVVSEYGLKEPNETPQSESPCFVSISRSGYNDGWPFLVIVQNYSPDCAGFHPGAIIIPETDILLLGAGTRLLAYSLDPPSLLWEDDADFGFWGWDRYEDTVLMAAELEIAAWNTEGHKLWARFMEPPWSYHVKEGVIFLDTSGRQSSFPLVTDPVEAIGRPPRAVGSKLALRKLHRLRPEYTNAKRIRKPIAG
jgi:hypothetical protein